MTSSNPSLLAPITDALLQLRSGQTDVHAFSQLARAQGQLLEQLPAPFTQVLGQLLDRLESSALFSEESCSFSQTELFDSLQLWLDKAQQRLGAGSHQPAP